MGRRLRKQKRSWTPVYNSDKLPSARSFGSETTGPSQRPGCDLRSRRRWHRGSHHDRILRDRYGLYPTRRDEVDDHLVIGAEDGGVNTDRVVSRCQLNRTNEYLLHLKRQIVFRILLRLLRKVNFSWPENAARLMSAGRDDWGGKFALTCSSCQEVKKFA